MNDPEEVAKLYRNRFRDRDRGTSDVVWRVLCRHFFQRYVAEGDTVLDLGAGGCEFLRHIVCGQRIAVDLNPEVAQLAPEGTWVLRISCDDLSPLPSESVDVVFASNVFEHLADTWDLLQTLRETHRVLRRGGRLLILQPNIRILKGRYWDFIDHRLPLTDRSLVEALRLVDFEVREARSRFLPFTKSSRWPKSAFFVRLYLLFPVAHRILGEQAWVVGAKP